MGRGNTPEGKVKAAVKKVLAKYPESYWRWPVPYGYGHSGLDCYGCHYGWFVSIETKAPGEKPTPRQTQDIREINIARGKAFVVDGPETLARLEGFLEQVKTNESTGQSQA